MSGAVGGRHLALVPTTSDDGEPVHAPAGEPVQTTAEALVERFCSVLERRGMQPTTVVACGRRLRLFLAEFGGELPLNPSAIDEYLVGRGLSSASRCWWLSLLSTFYGWLERERIIGDSPIGDIDRPRLPRLKARPILTAELAAVLEVAREPVRSWVVLAAYAGLRCGEIAVASGRWLVEGGELVVTGKGGHFRTVPAHPLVLEVFAGAPRFGPLWDTTAQSVSHRGGRAIRRAGVDATMHQLRHWFATMLYRECEDLRTVQELLGHADPRTTAIYVAASTSKARAAIAGLPTPGS